MPPVFRKSCTVSQVQVRARVPDNNPLGARFRSPKQRKVLGSVSSRSGVQFCVLRSNAKSGYISLSFDPEV